MTDAPLPDKGFLAQLVSVIEKNITNDQFGVSELADQMNMSRSNLLRKVKKDSTLSVSQLISQVRLNRAMELLKKGTLNVSEVSHEVGFSSTSYFIKCFREYYGYPPGEVGKRDASPLPPPGTLPESTQEQIVEDTPEGHKTVPRQKWTWIAAAAMLITAAITLAVVFIPSMKAGKKEEKSIAVLPFKNDSNDSTNLYLINGLMESTLHKLQQIEDLRVISRTSVEKYRSTTKSIPEMGRELNVKYFVEGSGQKIGEHIVLNIQLIDAATDAHVWSKQYRRDSKDIFELQEEIAKNITQEIEVFISPEEERRIEKKPTEDLVAYDYFLKGRDLFYRSKRNDLENSIPLFKKAIERDPKFSLAYATAAMVYYYLDVFNMQKPHAAEVDDFAEKAILYDERSAESMIAKALSFAMKGQFELSIPYFEKALVYEPHSGLVLHFLTEFYSFHVPHPPKYLEYAIRKVQVDIGCDSATASFNYFHLGNSLMQNGFYDEAGKYTRRSLQLNPDNMFGFVNDYVDYIKDRDPLKARDRLLISWKRDTTRFYVLQEVAKVCSMAGDYTAAVGYYDRSIATMRMFGMDILKHEYMRVAFTYERAGQKDKAAYFAEQFKNFADKSNTMYKDMYLASYFSWRGDGDKAMKYFKDFANKNDNFIVWVTFIPEDPVLETLQRHPDFPATMKVIETKFRKKHDQLEEEFGEAFRNL